LPARNTLVAYNFSPVQCTPTLRLRDNASVRDRQTDGQTDDMMILIADHTV